MFASRGGGGGEGVLFNPMSPRIMSSVIPRDVLYREYTSTCGFARYMQSFVLFRKEIVCFICKV